MAVGTVALGRGRALLSARLAPLAGDPGTASAALVDRDGTIRGYLNLTPRTGGERRQGWARFRLRHNAGEGNRDIVLIAAARRLRFRDGRGSCVIDRYRTSRHRYREIACLVAGRRATTVVVGAALPSHGRRWGRRSSARSRRFGPDRAARAQAGRRSQTPVCEWYTNFHCRCPAAVVPASRWLASSQPWRWKRAVSSSKPAGVIASMRYTRRP